MSCSQLEWPLASADGLPLSDSECLLLLDADIDIIDFDGDLLRSFPCSTAKLDGGSSPMQVGEESSALLYPPSPPEYKPTRAQLASDLLHQLDAQCKTESFPSWFEEKVDLPIFEQVPALAPHYASPAAAAAARSDTAELLREFDTVYGAVELTHLTPPQSPPGPATQLLLSYAQHAAAPAPALAPPISPAPAPAPAWPPHLEREMAVVDELVRHSSAHLPAAASPAPSASSACSASSTDEEWERPRGARSEERRSRKKEQNKNAATRYRQKKKTEVEALLREESALRARRADLDNKCADLQREVRYLKGLMRDLFKAKGLIK